MRQEVSTGPITCVKLLCCKSTKDTLGGKSLISQEAQGPLMMGLVLMDEQDLLLRDEMDGNPFNSRQI